MLKYIADEIRFLVHLELNILIEDPQDDRRTSPKATLDSVPEIGRYLWQQTLSSLVRRDHSITQPRSRSLDFIVGSKRLGLDPNSRARQLDQQRFPFDLSDRDDDARLSIANVKCTEIEALRSNLSSSDALWNHQQELIVNTVNERAIKGPHSNTIRYGQ